MNATLMQILAAVAIVIIAVGIAYLSHVHFAKSSANTPPDELAEAVE